MITLLIAVDAVTRNLDDSTFEENVADAPGALRKRGVLLEGRACKRDP